MADPTYVQVNAPGSGAKISTVEVKEVQGVDTSGNAQTDDTLEQQVVSVANSRGDLVDDQQGQIVGLLGQILEELQLLNMHFSDD